MICSDKIIIGEKNTIGKIVSIKDGIIYVDLVVNIYDMQNIIGQNVTFDDRFIGEIGSMSSTMLEVSLVGEIVNGKFIIYDDGDVEYIKKE